MLKKKQEKTILDITSLPTAPFVETEVERYIESFCSTYPVFKLKKDKVGNFLVHYKQGRKAVKRPVCLAAHMDHPGFVAQKMITSNKLRAAWHGGVRPEYFGGTQVRFRVDDSWVKGKIQSVKLTGKKGAKRVSTADIEVSRVVPKDAPGMWHLQDSSIRNGKLYARVCDDLSCVAAMICTMENLVRANVETECYFLFTRAEEVGFAGALAACRLNTIPKKCIVIAAENSSELPNAKMGDGPILRVGDRLSTYTSAVTQYCNEVALKLLKKNRKFKYQRKLMDGGACESTAYCALGYDATGICIALGNYHNMGRNKKIGSEYVNIDDLSNLISWFTALASDHPGYTGQDATLLKKLADVEKEQSSRLKNTVRHLRK